MAGSIIVGCSNGSDKKMTPALFDTKSEAEQAAKNFGCTGAHKMGNKWMPCENHELHERHEHDHP